MKPEIHKMWIETLRTEEYEQGFGYLCAHNKHCAIGVLCELAIKNGVPLEKSNRKDDDENVCVYDEYSGLMPDIVMKWAQLKTGHVHLPKRNINVLMLNDGEKYTFSEIADLLEAEDPLSL